MYESKGTTLVNYFQFVFKQVNLGVEKMSDFIIGCCDEEELTHVHEVQGSVEIAEREEDPHNHRFATVTGEVIPCGRDNHIHKIFFRTDFYEDHFHTFCGRTCPAICVGGGRHVHFLEDETSFVDGHRHDFRVATLIENPIGEE